MDKLEFKSKVYLFFDDIKSSLSIQMSGEVKGSLKKTMTHRNSIFYKKVKIIFDESRT